MPKPVTGVWLTDTKRHEVYNAPGKNSLRSKTAKGTDAYVSGNEDVIVLAVDGDWVLIEYRTTTGHRRGYISRSYVPNSAYNNAGKVPKAMLIGTTTERTSLVNDTSMSNDAYIIQNMAKGTSVTVLAFDHSWGKNWAYVETYYQNKLVRGFIKLETINLTSNNMRG